MPNLRYTRSYARRNDAGDEVDLGPSEEALSAAVNKLLDLSQAERDAASEVLESRKAIYDELYDYQVNLFKKQKESELEIEKEANKKYLDVYNKGLNDALAREEKKNKKKGGLTSEEKEAFVKRYNEEHKIEGEERNKVMERFEADARKRKARQEKEDIHKQAEEQADALNEALFGEGNTLGKRFEALQDMFTVTNEDGTKEIGFAGIVKGLDTLAGALSDYLSQLESTINQVANIKSEIDTRLQGSKQDTDYSGSYWGQISDDITSIAALSPYVEQSEIVENIQTMVNQGIAFNVEQRAFLETIKDDIATTFSAFDSTLLQLIRIQQQDTTAGRLGMEASLNAFLNEMYESTEYLESLATSVRSSLYEAEALMEADVATEFEYQVQKWLGSLYSVGMSDSAVSSIASTLGGIASGEVSSLTSGGTGNLLIMAANNAGLSISDILTDSLTAEETNTLLESVVEYLAELYETSSDSLVVQQQLADVYGVSASDLLAAYNLMSTESASGETELTTATLEAISANNMTYTDMMAKLTEMADTMYQRISIGEMAENIYSNLTYSLASSVAGDVVSYSMYKFASLLDATTGGIAIPTISVMGTSVDLNTTVADLIRVASLGSGLISGIGTMISSLGSGAMGGFSGSGMLNALGITSNITSVSRGTGATTTATSGSGVSESGYVGNSDADTIYNKTLSDANDSANQQMIEAQEDETSDLTNKDLNESILSIYQLLVDVVDGTKSWHIASGGITSWSTTGVGDLIY